MMKSFFSFRAFLALLCWLAVMHVTFAATPAYATDQLDVRTALKTLSQLTEKPDNSSLIAVLYNPNDPASEADAKSIAAFINTGDALSLGIKLTAQVMTVASLAWIPNAKIAFLADGMTTDLYNDVHKVSMALGILTISSDLNCVNDDKCVMGIDTKKSIEIYISTRAAKASRINFSPAFIMLVKQV